MRQQGLSFWLRGLVFRSAVRLGSADEKKADPAKSVAWRTSTTGWGLRFTERLRNHFRRRWLRLRHDPPQDREET